MFKIKLIPKNQLKHKHIMETTELTMIVLFVLYMAIACWKLFGRKTQKETKEMGTQMPVPLRRSLRLEEQEMLKVD